MRAFVVALVLLTADPSAAQSFNRLPEAVGGPWRAVATTLPPPDSGRVTAGTGDLLWTQTGDAELASVRVRIRHGVVREVAAEAVPSEDARRPLMRAWLMLKQEHGAPDAQPFYTAETTRGYNGLWVDVAIDPYRQTVRVRQPASPPPARPDAPPPPAPPTRSSGR